MTTRRNFVKLAAVAGVLGAAGARSAALSVKDSPSSGPTADGDDRAYWRGMAGRLADPVLGALARRQLKAEMPVEAHRPEGRAVYTHLEALGRLLAGIAPWLELGADDSPDGRERARLAGLAREGLDAATDPASPDFMNFTEGGQPLVDAAFLAQALLRAPRELWSKLEPRAQANIVAALEATRRIQPYESNWLLFASEVETFLHRADRARDDARLFGPLRKHQQWYLGDGVYGDGPRYHCDYYNSFVIQPMLLDASELAAELDDAWRSWLETVRTRLTRFAAIQERSIAPDGSFPAVGRSIAYRCGAFHALALAALRGLLPAEVKPAQARVALTAVIRRTLEAPGTWDDSGWLTLGLAGHQPSLAEGYISTGSLYLCSVALLPLGLPPEDAFWSDAAAPTTWEKAWGGHDLPGDQALKEQS